MYHKNYVLILLILASCTQGAVAQGFFSGRMETGLHVGTSHYIGEINNNVYGNQLFSAGISTKYHFNKTSEKDRTWGIRLDGNFTRIEGDDQDSSDPSTEDRGLNFKNNLLELAAMGEFHFFNFRPNRAAMLFSPYVFAGVGAIYHDPKSSSPLGKISLIDEMIEEKKHSKTAVILPFGAGVKLNLSGPFSVGLEVNYRYVFSDFIDGIGNNLHFDFADLPIDLNRKITQTEWQVLAAGPIIGNDQSAYDTLVSNGVKRGEKGNDFFMTTVLKVSYTFYKWRDPIWK